MRLFREYNRVMQDFNAHESFLQFNIDVHTECLLPFDWDMLPKEIVFCTMTITLLIIIIIITIETCCHLYSVTTSGMEKNTW